MINRGKAAGTWALTLKRLDEDIELWERASRGTRLPKGTVILWLSGNDVHNRYSGAGRTDDNLLADISLDLRSVVLKLADAGAQSVILFGPLPRFGAHLDGIAWEKTASYKMERMSMKTLNATAKLLGCPVYFVAMGRQLTKKMFGRHSVRESCREWFRDEVHLNATGYAKVADVMPVWLRFAK